MSHQTENTEEISDVLIVGGGMSGLFAAWRLLNSGQNLSVTVVEKRWQVGGRKTRDIAKLIGNQGYELFKNPAFIVVSGGISTDGEMIVKGIEDAVGQEVTIFGGLAGDDFEMTGTYVFTNQNYNINGLVTLVLDEDYIQVKGLATSGWQPVGTVRTITKSEENIVYTTDGQPALDVLVKYMGVNKNLDEMKEVIINVGSEFPMQLQREGAEPVIRAKQRHLSLGPMVSNGIDHVKDVWGAPMAGFFSYGEIGKATKGKHEFHNNTCSIVVFAEK